MLELFNLSAIFITRSALLDYVYCPSELLNQTSGMKQSAKPAQEKLMDRQITLSVQQVLTYSAFLLTIGASIYTFFKAIPKIDKLDETVTQLQVSNTRVEVRLDALRETFIQQAKVVEAKKSE